MHMIDTGSRHAKLPPGFVRHRRGKDCPFPPRARVELMVRTADGIGSSGATLAGVHDWGLSPSAIGGIVGYRRLGV